MKKGRTGHLPKERPPHKVRVKEHFRSKPVGEPMPPMAGYEMPPPPSVGDVPIRSGHPFPSAEEWAKMAVSPFSNFVGGDEKDLRTRSEDWAGRRVGPPGRDGDVTGLDRVDAHEVFEPRKPLTTKLIKPASSRTGLYRAQ